MYMYMYILSVKYVYKLITCNYYRMFQLLVHVTCTHLYLFFRYLFYFFPEAIADDRINSLRVCVSRCPDEGIFVLNAETTFFDWSETQGLHLCRYDVTRIGYFGFTGGGANDTEAMNVTSINVEKLEQEVRKL